MRTTALLYFISIISIIYYLFSGPPQPCSIFQAETKLEWWPIYVTCVIACCVLVTWASLSSPPSSLRFPLSAFLCYQFFSRSTNERIQKKRPISISITRPGRFSWFAFFSPAWVAIDWGVRFSAYIRIPTTTRASLVLPAGVPRLTSSSSPPFSRLIFF